MPAYIVMDTSGLPKDLLYKKHMEIKKKINDQLPECYKEKDEVKD